MVSESTEYEPQFDESDEEGFDDTGLDEDVGEFDDEDVGELDDDESAGPDEAAVGP